MTQDEIIRMAASIDEVAIRGTTDWTIRFAALVAEATKEKAAKIADAELMNTNMLTSYPPKSSAAWNIAAAIRSMK